MKVKLMIRVMKGNLRVNGLKWFYRESDYRWLLCLEWVDERRFRGNEGNARWKGIEEVNGVGWRITRLFEVLKGECRKKLLSLISICTMIV